jgi:hypothetical protein
VGSNFAPAAMPPQNVTYFSPFATDNLPLVISVMDQLGIMLVVLVLLIAFPALSTWLAY